MTAISGADPFAALRTRRYIGLLVLAAVLGVTVGLMLPEAIQWAIIAAGTIAALFIRYGVLHDPVWSRVDLAWLAVFAATWLPVAALLGHWPFR